MAKGQEITMGQRNRHGQKVIAHTKKVKMVAAMKEFTRMDAEKALANGADPAEQVTNKDGKKAGRFTEHPNYHVRAKAWRKMGMPLPEDEKEREKFLASIHVNPEKVAGFVKTGDEVPQAEEQVNG